jgi:transcriptional regulator with XRE-family HTH domain
MFDISPGQAVHLSDLGAVIRERREAPGLTQARLAQLSGLSRQTLVGLARSSRRSWASQRP